MAISDSTDATLGGSDSQTAMPAGGMSGSGATAPQVSGGSATQSSTTPGAGESSISNRALLEALGKSGKYDPSGFDSDDTLLESIGSALQDLKMVEQYKHFAPATREYLTEREQYQKWKAEQAAAAKQQKQPEPEQPDPWGRLEYDKQWDDVVARDPETGRWVPKNAFVNPEVALKREAYDRQLADRVREMANDPLSFIKPGFERHIMPLVEQMIQQHFNQVQQQQAAQQYVSQQAQNWVVHENGQPVIDPATGQEMLTPAGLHALRVSEKLSAIPGLTYEQRRELLDMAMQGFVAPPTQKQQTQTAAAAATEPTAEEKKTAFLDSVEAKQRGATPPRGSTSERGAQPGIKQHHGQLDSDDWGRIAERHMRRAGLLAN